jgi:HlyD family secretion protein
MMTLHTTTCRFFQRGAVPVLSAALLFAAAGLAPVSPARAQSSDKAAGRAASTVPSDRAIATVASFDVVTTAGGELEARNKIEVRSPLDNPANIVQIVNEGINVKKGDLLLQLNVEEIENRLKEEELRLIPAEAELVAAQSAYDIQINENASKIRQAELKVTLAELALRQWVDGDVAKKRQELELGMNKAELELERLAQRYLRSQQLFDEGFVSRDERDRDEVAYIEAISGFNTARLASEVYEKFEFVKDEKTKQSDLGEAIAELERVSLNNVAELKNKGSQLEQQRTQVGVLSNRIDELKVDFAAARVIAPADGLVVYATSLDRGGWRGGNEGPLQIGQQVFPNQLLMILPDTSEMVAAVRVNEALAGRVRQGQQVSVRVDAAGGAVFDGTVESIGVMAETGGWRDPNLREYTVRIGLQPIEGVSLKPAMRCEGRITLDVVKDAISIPVQGVFNEGPVQFVYTQEGGRWVKTPVRVGRRSDTQAEIRAGLAAGTIILLRDPSSGETINRPWNPEQLTVAGYKLDENGRVVAEGPPRGMPGGARGGAPGGPAATGRPASGRPQGAGTGGGAPAAPAVATPATATPATSVPSGR